MNSLKRTAALSIVLAFALGISPVPSWSQQTTDGTKTPEGANTMGGAKTTEGATNTDGAVNTDAATGTDGAKNMDGAKGLFLAQLESPEKSLNTGLQYWIELHREGQTRRVSNKFAFKSGDQIKFHVKSNINGYAYILLKSGSRGEQSVLFPDQNGTDDNKVERGKDYTLPEADFLTFDENPGTEKLSLVLSRTPIDAQAYLNNTTEAPTLIASADTGSKDLIPQRVLVHYGEREKGLQPATIVVKTPVVSSGKSSKTSDSIVASKDKKKPASQKIANKPSQKPQGNVTKSKAGDGSEGTTTVVSELPNNVLNIEVDLHHI